LSSETGVTKLMDAPTRLSADSEYQPAIDVLFAVIDRSQAAISQDRIRIQRLKAETSLIKAETALIDARTQARLDLLGRML